MKLKLFSGDKMKLKLKIFIFSVFAMHLTNGLTFSVEPNLSYIKTGASFNLTCVTEQSATWMFNGNIFYPELNTSYFFKNNTSVNDSGSYSCSDGNYSVTINITVLEALPKPLLILNNKSVWSGSSISGICNVLLNSNISYNFFHNNETVHNASSLNEFNLSNLTSERSGYYSCSVSINGFEPTFSDPVNLIVQILVTVQNQTYQENVDANMTCVTPSSEKISNYNWFFENKLRYSSNTSNTLTIKNLSRTDAGNYLCQIITAGGVTANSTGNLDVQYQDTPAFTNLDPNPVEGTNVTLNCTTNANVNLTYQIFKNNVLIANTSNYVIYNIQRTDSGQYNCTSSSSGNQFSKTFFQDVNVLYQDTPSFTNLDPNPVEGTNVTLNCTTNANVNLTYQIFKNNVSIANTSYYVIQSIQRTDSGQYSCMSSSSRTQVSKTFFQEVKVLYPPNALYFSNNIPDVVNVKISQNFTVQCCTTDLGVPIANLSWYSNGKENLNTALSNKCISLSIMQVSRNSSGKYTCYANSSLNFAYKSLDLTIQEVPDAPIILANITTTFMSIWLQWLSQFTGNEPIINYTLSYQINGSLITPHTISVKDTMYNITGLNAFSIYRIDVKAVNSYGESQSATIYIQTNETAPTTPRNLKISNNDPQALILFWDSPEPRNGNIINYLLCYQLEASDGKPVINKTQNCTYLGSVLNHTICCLEKYSNYSIQLMAKNSYLGLPIITSAFTQEAVPTGINNFSWNASESSSLVTWDQPDHIYGVLRGYTVSYRKVGDSNFTISSVCIKIMTLACNISDLTPNTQYEIRVMVENQLKSYFSAFFGNTSTAAPPPYNGILPVVVDSDVTQNTFKIQLVSFSDIYGPIRKRDIVVVKLSSSSLPTTNPSSYSDDDISNNKDGMYRAGTVSSDVTEFIVGSGKTSKRKRKSLSSLFQNPALDSGSYYTVFIRGYVSDDKYQTTSYYPPVKTQTNTSNAGTIIAIVVPIVFTVVVLIFAILNRFLKKKGGSSIPTSLEMKRKEI